MSMEKRTIVSVQQELVAALARLDDLKRETSRARIAETDQTNRVNGLRGELTRLVAPLVDFDVLEQTDEARRRRQHTAVEAAR